MLVYSYILLSFQSGSPLADWAAIDDVYRVQNTSRVYGLEVGCTVESSYKLLQCLNRRSYEELASAPIKVFFHI